MANFCRLQSVVLTMVLTLFAEQLLQAHATIVHPAASLERATGRPAAASPTAALHGQSAPPPPPTGEGGHCPFFSDQPGGHAAGPGTGGSSICPPVKALKKWQGLKFGLFLHWCAHAANT